MITENRILSLQDIEKFHYEGFLVLTNFIDRESFITTIIQEYSKVLHDLCQILYKQNEISSDYSNLSFNERLIHLYQETGREFAQNFDFSLPSEVKSDTPFWVGPAVFNILTNQKLLDAVELLIGPEIFSNPVQHVRIKPPEQLLPKGASDSALVGSTAWHQDNGVVTTEADDTNMLTVWISLSEATEEQGCLMLIPGSHETKLRTHCPHSRKGLLIPNKLLELDRMTPVPTNPGDVILMNKYTCHGSLPNESDTVRWSLDLRYNPVGQKSGRDELPGFVARSRRQPDSELNDPKKWSDLWHQTRAVMSKKTESIKRHRWDGTHAICA